MIAPGGKREVAVAGTIIQVDWGIRASSSTKDLVLVVLDPDEYLADSVYREARKSGTPALRNLQAFSRESGDKVWEAELPEPVDYYYELVSTEPIRALSYSGFRCEIDEVDGHIKSRQFMK